MTREEIYAQVTAVLGGVPGWLSGAPDEVLAQFWTTLSWLLTDTNLAARDKALVTFGAAAVLHCKYCIPFHKAQLRMHGMDDAQIKDASWTANSVAGFGTYLHGIEYDLDQFLAELEGAVKHITGQGE